MTVCNQHSTRPATLVTLSLVNHSKDKLLRCAHVIWRSISCGRSEKQLLLQLKLNFCIKWIWKTVLQVLQCAHKMFSWILHCSCDAICLLLLPYSYSEDIVLYSLIPFIGVLLTTEESTPLGENSTTTRHLCVRLADFGAGLERDVNISLDFEAKGSATECMLDSAN